MRAGEREPFSLTSKDVLAVAACRKLSFSPVAGISAPVNGASRVMCLWVHTPKSNRSAKRMILRAG